MRLLLALLLVLAANTAHAEQFVDLGDFRIHYAALNTTQLTPDVARKFNVQRSSKQILLVLNAQQLVGGKYESVAATASGTATTLLGHVQSLELRPIREADVHYVIASFETLEGEYMTVDARVVPAGATAPITVKFRQQFYMD
ncbi:MAG: DUF4426 domain-containing protein [Pseudomonadota bacterium]|nr:DUF4426 domain-containing protein [Pseudomonadota bacterium]